MSERFVEHLENDEYLRRRVRDVDNSLQNLAGIVFPRLDALERGAVWGPVQTAATVPGRMTFTVLETKRG